MRGVGLAFGAGEAFGRRAWGQPTVVDRDAGRVSVTVLSEAGKAWPSSLWEGLGKHSRVGGLPAQALVEDELGHWCRGVIPAGHGLGCVLPQRGQRRSRGR